MKQCLLKIIGGSWLIASVGVGTGPGGAAIDFSHSPTPQEFFQARVFEEPLVPIGQEPSIEENRAFSVALQRYSQRTSPDDFSSPTEFLHQHPKSSWRAALLLNLGFDYYNMAHYSRALESWQDAWAMGQKATNAAGKFLADRAVCELASLYSRLGRMNELAALLKSVESRVFLGGAAERISLAREALSMMQHQPGISFRCGPLALHSIKRSLDPEAPGDSSAIFNSASTQRGFSLSQVADLSKTVGLNYQMAFREQGGEFLIPSVVHWKVGHYAALIRREGNRYLLEDPTFGNSVWATKQALEAETSGYFLIPPGELPRGWQSVDAKKGGTIWGKGVTSGIDPDNYTDEDMVGDACSDGTGMAVARIHLGLANLQLRDTPVGYQPPVGPAVRFTVRYNHRDYIQPASQISSVLGPKWTHDWHAYIRDTPGSPSADVKYFVGGGGARTFTGFNAVSQAFAPQQLNQSRLSRTGPNSYEMLFPDGSKNIFALRSGSTVFLTQVTDVAGNAVTLTWSGSRLVSLTDAIGQVTTLSYEHPSAPLLITRITDPFGRVATFGYRPFDLPLISPTNLTRVYALTNITDVLGLSSRFEYMNDTNMVINRMTTPYGTSSFATAQGGGPGGTTRSVEIQFPDGSRERAEYNQSSNLVAFADPPALVPKGMNVFNQYMYGRNTFYWNRNASAQGYGDYAKAKIFHWLHAPNVATTAGILESVKEPLENRVWLNYAGQASPYHTVGSSDQPTRIGRVLDDGTTQLETYAYNAFGHLTISVDAVGRELSYIYATNGIDPLEVRQTQGANNELLFRATYNHQHRPLTTTDADGQTTTFTYNARGQPMTQINPRGETNTFSYDPNGYLIQVDGPIPGTSDSSTFTYDAFGRTRTQTDESGYTLTFDYDVMDRVTRVTYPDATFDQYTYDRLDLVGLLDSAGRQTLFEYDNMRQLTRQTDSLGRVTRYEWCSCDGLGSLTDPMGRKTEWHSDVQGRLVRKQYGDGSKITYTYENATSRLRQMIDEKQQITQYLYNRDNTLKTIAYANAAIPTLGVSFTYDATYQRITSMTDGHGTTRYSYYPITPAPTLGAGELATVDGPLADDIILFTYDELGRAVQRTINGVASAISYDAAGRIVVRTNALGVFAYAYDGPSGRLVFRSLPGSQIETRAYGNAAQDLTLQRITHTVGSTKVSEFLYGHDVPRSRVTAWSQQVGLQPPDRFSFGYDSADQLLSAAVTNAGALLNAFTYAYDLAGNRVTEQAGVSSSSATYNALNQISIRTGPGSARTNEWDAQDRLVAVTVGDRRTEFSYDGLDQLASLRTLTNGVETSLRRFLWAGGRLCEERDATGAVTKRFFGQGMRLERGPNAGNYFYTRDHLGSIRELIDGSGTVRARYAYDPYGRQTKLTGDMEADFGFAGMFWLAEADLNLTLHRAYDPELGRWLSRDPLDSAETEQGPNLYAYVANDPVNRIDPLGLAWTLETLQKHKGNLSPGHYQQLVAAFQRAHPNTVIPPHLQPVPPGPKAPPPSPRGTPPPAGGGDLARRPKGSIAPRPKGELALRPKGELALRKPQGVPPPARAPRPNPPSPGRGVGGGLLDMGMTILTMTDCNTVNGILGLVRQGKGGSVNIYQDRMLKELEELDPTP